MKILNSIFIGISFIGVFIFSSCNALPEINEATMLDGSTIIDSSILKPQEYLISQMIPNPTEEQKKVPVVICSHGYSASTFEWSEFRDYADQQANVYVSMVLLGGHGLDYDSFKNATWSDWQKPIFDEYQRLSYLGYENISIAASSTSCPLVLDLFSSGKMNTLTAPKQVFFIDPIVIPSSKLLTIVDLIGWFIPYVETELDPEEEGLWYQYRPSESLNQLRDLLNHSRKSLEKGVVLTSNTQLKVYKSIYDSSADPVGAVLLYKGLSLSSGAKIEIEMVDSKLHVFTRLAARASYTESDVQTQQKTFSEMLNRLQIVQ